MTDRYQPQPFWLLKGAVLGAGCGAAVGVLLMVNEVWGRVEEPDTAYIPEGLSDAMVIGIVFGGFIGVLTGLLVGAVMAVLLSSHLPLDVQRRRALILGTVLPPLTLCAVVLMFVGDLTLDGGAGLALFLSPGLIGGPLARWATGFHLPRPQMSEGG